ncbi:hypothetical protein [Periweissella fabalis]|uniref:Uncharacterized protein n=1 Tax=Periweissella fabalis TaxID=1070421 RepID=A0A7X6N461_9LACO|nr:hypothetical protein [Periweissella fabalis]MCM0599294.1 hypothetical protein [Periweissella fabalis]NKZ23573.1 hypothetical protein [Periweissella fabalis]
MLTFLILVIILGYLFNKAIPYLILAMFLYFCWVLIKALFVPALIIGIAYLGWQVYQQVQTRS